MIHRRDKAVEFTEIHLSDVRLPFCTGCSNCFRKGHSFCPHHEKIQPILDAMAESDGIIYFIGKHYAKNMIITYKK
jgi:multimeric flavodoxin WrbA